MTETGALIETGDMTETGAQGATTIAETEGVGAAVVRVPP